MTVKIIFALQFYRANHIGTRGTLSQALHVAYLYVYSATRFIRLLLPNAAAMLHVTTHRHSTALPISALLHHRSANRLARNGIKRTFRPNKESRGNV